MIVCIKKTFFRSQASQKLTISLRTIGEVSCGKIIFAMHFMKKVGKTTFSTLHKPMKAHEVLKFELIVER